MSEKLNWVDELRKSFQGFEPEVSGDWKHMERDLDKIDSVSSYDMARRVRNAQRIAVSAAAIAAGMALWVFSPTLTDKDIASNGGALAGMEEQAVEVPKGGSSTSAPSLFSPSGDSSNMHLSEGARTSNTVIINLPSLSMKSSANAVGSVSNRTVEYETRHAGSSNNERNKNDGHGGVEEIDERTDAGSNPSSEAKLEEALNALTASVQEACAGTEVAFALKGLDQEGSVLWNFGDGGFSQELAPKHLYDDAGSYDITVSVRAHGDGMIRTRTVENMIVVRPKPEALMNWEYLDATANQAHVRLIDDTENASSSTWLIEQEGLTGAETKLAIPGDYHVNLVASNKFGCQDIAVKDIRLGSRREAVAPALFSPDGDGRYDEFLPLILTDFNGKWELSIWDGMKQIFSSTTIRRPWKGEIDSGGTVQPGSKYTWKLVTEAVTGEKHLFVDEVLIDGE